MSEPALILWLSRSVVDAMQGDATALYPVETGGVLMGYWAQDGSSVVATAMIGPGPRAKRSTDGFTPDHEWQKEQIAEHYFRSGRQESYLGDWHCHPGAEHAGLSGKDRRTLRRIISHADARAPSAIMVILIGGPIDWGFTGWTGQVSHGFIMPRLTLTRLLPRLIDNAP